MYKSPGLQDSNSWRRSIVRHCASGGEGALQDCEFLRLAVCPNTSYPIKSQQLSSENWSVIAESTFKIWLIPMPSAEKTNDQPSAPPQDLPPSYENTILPPCTIPSASATPSVSTPLPSQNPLDALSRLKTIDFPKYCVAESKLSDDSTTVTTTKAELAGTQYALVKFIHEQAALPPKPLMVIRGTHLGGLGGGSTSHGEPVVDFELKINLTSLLDIDNGQSAGLRSSSSCRIRVKSLQDSSPAQGSRADRGSSLSPLEQWVKRFCEDKTENRR